MPLPQGYLFIGLWAVSLGVHIWRPPRSRCDWQHCCYCPGGNEYQCTRSCQTAVQWQHSLDQRGWKAQNGRLTMEMVHLLGKSKYKNAGWLRSYTDWRLMYSMFSLGCRITSQNPLLWPERKNLHCFGYQPGRCWWESFSKSINYKDDFTLRAQDSVYSAVSVVSLLFLFLRHQWSLAETIMTLAAQTAPSERLLTCMMALPSVQVCGMLTTAEYWNLKFNTETKNFLLQLMCLRCRHGSPELCWWCLQRCHMGSPAQWRWCWLVRLTPTVHQIF